MNAPYATSQVREDEDGGSRAPVRRVRELHWLGLRMSGLPLGNWQTTPPEPALADPDGGKAQSRPKSG
jgi:hypothetical protein